MRIITTLAFGITALAVSLVVYPTPGGRFDGRALLAVILVGALLRALVLFERRSAR